MKILPTWGFKDWWLTIVLLAILFYTAWDIFHVEALTK
jgi:hypothetical protein